MRMNVSDENLALAAAAGDRAAFATLMERVYDRIHSLAFRLTGSAADADDITQDVCAALPAKLQSFRGDAKLQTWLYRVVVNAVHDARRRGATRAKASNGWGDWEIARQVEIVENEERRAWLQLAMNALTPPELRETLILLFDGLTHAQIGVVLDVPEGTVSWRISQAKKKLKLAKELEA